MKPYSASADYLERCGIDPTKFISWREFVQAANLDDNFNILVPLYIGAQRNASERTGHTFGENPLLDMLALGTSKEAAESTADMALDVYGHRTPAAWAERLIMDAVWGME
jgi:hypothetical protein